MPELPEVETTRRGLAPHVEGRHITGVVLRRPDLRWAIPPEVAADLPGQRVTAVRRRAKYLLLDTAPGSALLHLGMSGMLRVLRFTDPRRFGCLLWQPAGTVHALLRDLGPEPLSDAFDGDYLAARSRGRKAPVKAFLMDQRIVVGVGNIYAAEALFAAGISPVRPAGRISRERYARLADEVKRVLDHSITRGGTTLRDFISPDGAPGYFEQELAVYGREGEPCVRCGRPLRDEPMAGRATAWCTRCQR